ncbi:MAG: PIG-L deacetylase family protein [Ilumatobacteraceae bacterium]
MAANEPGQPPLTSTARIADWSEDIDPPPSALAIGAHPDDVEFGCGGTLAKWAGSGCVVHHLVLTDGSKGTWDVGADLPALVATRQAEQRAAAAALGGRGEVVFLGQIDGELEQTRSLTGEVARWIRVLRPTVVLGHDPWKRYRLHPDHRAAGFITCDAIVAARDPHFFTEQRIPHHRPGTLLLWEADEPDHAEILDETAIAAKLAALEAHASQFESTMKAVDRDQLELFRRRVSDRLAENGANLGRPAAEIFKRITDL